VLEDLHWTIEEPKIFIFKPSPLPTPTVFVPSKGWGLLMLDLCSHGCQLCGRMPTLKGVVHYVVAIKCIVIALATDLTRAMRDLISTHIEFSLLGWVSLIKVPEVTMLVGSRVATSASEWVVSVVLGSRWLSAWVESWKVLLCGSRLVTIASWREFWFPE